MNPAWVRNAYVWDYKIRDDKWCWIVVNQDGAAIDEHRLNGIYYGSNPFDTHAEAEIELEALGYQNMGLWKTAVPPKLKRDWIGLIVESKTPIRNGLGEMPALTKYYVVKNHGGLSLVSKACSCCGLQFMVSGIPESDVYIVGDRGEEEWRKELSS